MNKKDPTNLTPKQEAFCQSVAAGMTQADAYRSAYRTTNAKSSTVIRNAAELMKNNKVATRVAELEETVKAKVTSKTIATRERTLEIASEIMEREDVRPADRLKAAEVIARMQGYNAPDKVELSAAKVRRTPDEMRAIVSREIQLGEADRADNAKGNA